LFYLTVCRNISLFYSSTPNPADWVRACALCWRCRRMCWCRSLTFFWRVKHHFAGKM